MPNPSLQNHPDSAPAALLTPVSIVTLRFKELSETGVSIADPTHRRVKIRIGDTMTSGGKLLQVSVLETTAKGDLAWHRYEFGSESEVFVRSSTDPLILKIVATEAAAPGTATTAKRKSSLTIPPTTEVDGDDPE